MGEHNSGAASAWMWGLAQHPRNNLVAGIATLLHFSSGKIIAVILLRLVWQHSR
jgi:hypothetical protein